MKKLVFGLLLLLTAGSFSSCEDKDKIPAPTVKSTPLIFPIITADKSYYIWSRARAAESTNPVRPVFEFTIDLGDQRDVQIKTVEIYKSYRRGSTLGPRVLAREVSSFPATITMDSQEAITGLKRLVLQDAPAKPYLVDVRASSPTAPNSQIVISDQIVFTFEYVLQDGSRVITTPLTNVQVQENAAGGAISTIQVISGTQINAPYAAIAQFKAS